MYDEMTAQQPIEAPSPAARLRPPVARIFLPDDGTRLEVTPAQLADGEFMQVNQDVVARAGREGRLDIVQPDSAA